MPCGGVSNRSGAVYEEILSEDELIDDIVSLIEAGKVVGHVDGRMEFGPRALGNRSILGDPRSPSMQSLLNRKIKFRESFRPFAPSVLRERARELFDLPEDVESPYMLLVVPVRRDKRIPVAADGVGGLARLGQVRSVVPATTHVDDSARVQTVDAGRHPRFHRILARFDARTGCPALVNTSFNVRGEPIVCTPEDAYRCFMATGMDALVVGRFLLRKERQPARPGLGIEGSVSRLPLD